jgi:hypothetical protein
MLRKGEIRRGITTLASHAADTFIEKKYLPFVPNHRLNLAQPAGA